MEKRRAVVKGKPMPERPESKLTAEEIRQRIISRINEATGDNTFVCIMCKNTEWGLNYGYVNLPSSLAPLRMDPPSQGFPCVAICCTICGNTHFFNLLTLGFRDMEELELPAR